MKRARWSRSTLPAQCSPKMLSYVTFDEIESSLDRYTVVDVRSPKEYADSTIVGAVNIPLFTDEERAHVGTLYKVEGKAAAVKAGIEYVSRSLPRIYESFANLTKQRRILVFCARGGMRSESVAGLFASIGFPVTKLTNGYKGYRQHILLKLPELIAQKKFVTLYGKTGTGKTHILHEIERLGYDILDLEACANHRGSLLGAVGLPIKRSQKQFETLLYNALYNAKSDTIFTEGESKRIGTIYIPNELMDRLDCGRKLVIEATIETRKEVIREDYIGDNFDKASAIEGLTKLVRYIGTERVQEYTDLIESASYDKVIEELMIRYYDIVYNTTDSHERTFLNTSAEETAKEIVEYIFPF